MITLMHNTHFLKCPYNFFHGCTSVHENLYYTRYFTKQKQEQDWSFRNLEFNNRILFRLQSYPNDVIGRRYFSRHTKTLLVILQTESGLIREQHLIPITLYPTSMINSPTSSVRTVSCCQRNAHHCPMSIQITFIKPISDSFAWDFSSCYQIKLS